MWIRSQDKESLVHCIIVDIMKNRNGQYIIEAFVSGFNGMYSLGVYSTKEKALKVLDMIETFLNEGISGTFPMPQDNEVK
ncbi:MAG: hypothetical protein ACI4WW_02725 [Candidatus Coprovivens sp.]